MQRTKRVGEIVHINPSVRNLQNYSYHGGQLSNKNLGVSGKIITLWSLTFEEAEEEPASFRRKTKRTSHSVCLLSDQQSTPFWPAHPYAEVKTALQKPFRLSVLFLHVTPFENISSINSEAAAV